MNNDVKRNMIGNVVWAISILAVAFALNLAREAGYLGAETPQRITTTMMGLMVAWLGNRMPKAIVPSACARQAKRVAGWTMTLSGLIYAALYAFAPLHVAFVYGCGAIVAGLLITLTYCLSLRASRKSA